MKYSFYLLFLSVLCLPTSSLAQVIVPLLSSDGKIYVAAEIDTIDASEPKMVSAVETGQFFFKSIKDKGVKAGYPSFTSEDGSRARVESGQSPLNLKMLGERVESISYPQSAIAWGDYLLTQVKYKLENREIDFREDYFCTQGKCLKSIKEYGQVMENVYAISANSPEKLYSGTLSDEIVNQSNSLRVLTAISPKGPFEMLKKDSANSLKLGVSIIGLGEWQCIQCGVLSADDDANSTVNNTIREAAEQIKLLQGSGRASKVMTALKQYSTLITGEQTIPLVSWSSASPEMVGVDISTYRMAFEGALKGSIVGHIPDGDYVYLIVSDAATTPEKKALKFQIFIMKSKLDFKGRETYLFDPETAEDLDSQYLVYDPEFLSIIHSIVKATL